MGFFDWHRKKKKKKPVSSASDEDAAEMLWASLCEDPNQEGKLTELVALCEKNTGFAGACAALEELSQMEGSVLPGKMLLSLSDRKDGRLPIFQNEREERALDVPDIRRTASYSSQSLEPDESVFRGTYIKESLEERRSAAREDGPERPGVYGSEPPGQMTKSSIQEEWEHEPQPVEDLERSFLFALDGPVWSAVFPELSELLPKRERTGRIGLYFFSSINRENSLSSINPGIATEDLTIGFPLCLAEHFFFLSSYRPVVLCPIRYAEGIVAEKLEADVQTLLAICSQQKLDYLLTGTVTFQKGRYSIRCFVFHKQQQSIRVISTDFSSLDAAPRIRELFRRLLDLFPEREEMKYTPKIQEISFYPIDERFLLQQLLAERKLFLQFLIHKSYCSPEVIKPYGNISEDFTRLITGMPQNQLVFLNLLCSMHLNQASGKKDYLENRAALYHGAEKNKIFSMIRVLVPKINMLLRDPQ